MRETWRAHAVVSEQHWPQRPPCLVHLGQKGLSCLSSLRVPPPYSVMQTATATQAPTRMEKAKVTGTRLKARSRASGSRASQRWLFSSCLSFACVTP